MIMLPPRFLEDIRSRNHYAEHHSTGLVLIYMSVYFLSLLHVDHRAFLVKKSKLISRVPEGYIRN